MCFVFFFFQAEDGIRDIGVTGVQTCALPIWLIQQLFRGAERGRAFGMFGAVVGVSTAVGPVVGGLLLQVADWRWIFYVNVPIGVVAFVLAWRLLPRSGAGGRGHIDVGGVLLLGAGALALLLPLVQAEAGEIGRAHV